MTQHRIAAVAMAALLVLAGCSGAPSGGDATTESGTVSFYVSDRPNAIDDFEHLNVTITEVAFASASAENATTADGNGTETTAGNGSADDADSRTTYDVNATVDLTQYRGANATLLGNLSVPAGDYSTVEMDVSAVNGTLEGGSGTEVKLPSGGLKVPKGMSVSADDPVSFVFDVSVVKAGNSGKYVLKPVVGESGTDVPIDARERRGGPGDRGAPENGGPERGGGPDGDGSTTTGSDDDRTGTSGQMNFYVSDERNAIGDFEHLNVTVSSVGLHASGDAASDSEEANETGAGETNETANDTTEGSDSPAASTPPGTTADPTAERTTTERESTAENDAGEESESGPAGWNNYKVDNATVDLTEYQGANATRIADFGVPNATYDKVFVHVAEIDGTLTDGTEVNVKLPSGRLHVNNEFTVGGNESVDFVFDITVFEAGNSGKYVLKPVVGESGTDVPIETPDERADRDGARNGGEDRRNGSGDDRGPSGPRGPPGERTSDERTATTTTETAGMTSTGETTAPTTDA